MAAYITILIFLERFNFRLRDSINTVESLIDYAIELGHDVCAITEHDTIASHIRAEKYYNKIKKENPNFKLIRGNEIYLVRNGLNKDNYNKDLDRYFHFILLARDAEGHKQIREISSRAWMRSYMARGQRRVPTYYQDLIDIIGKNPGHVIATSACFRAGTQVETKQGWKNIEDIQKGDFVINRYGKWEEVLEPTSRLTHQYGYIIEVVGNDKPITCTDNHQFLVITNNVKTPKWIQAKDLILKSGGTKHIGLEPTNCQYSQSPVIKKEEWENSYFKETKFSHRKYHLPEEITITPEIMRMFGLFLGDGCISLKKAPRISFTFNEKEYDNYMDSFMYKAGEQLGINWNINRRPQSHRVDISSSAVEIVNLFYSLFGNVKANTKRVPSRLRISESLDYELIFGYLLADGYFRNRLNSGKASGYISGEFVSASISRQLSYDIYSILNQLGISSSISFSKGRVDSLGTTHQDSWYVHGSNKFLGTIDKLKNYSHNDIIKIFKKAIEYKKKDFIEIDGTKYRKIRFKNKKQIEMHEKVYCLNNTTHSFKCENLIVHNCLGGCLPTQLIRNRDNGAPSINIIKQWITQMQGIFGREDFYFEMQPSFNKDQIYVNHKLIELSDEMGIKYIITNDAHYLKKEDRPIHKAFLNSQKGDREVDDFYATTYLMNTKEIEYYMLEEMGEEVLQAAYETINEIKDKCEDYSLLKPLKIPRLNWKEFDIKEAEKEYWKNKIPYVDKFLSSEYPEDRHLIYAIIDRIRDDRTLQDEETLKEIGACLEDTWISSEVNGSRWSAYFLNLQNIINACWEAGTLVGAGRGSGVGFILLYLLGITQINPLREKTKTFRWRFLNPARVSVLDVDIDIEGSKRSKVLSHFRQIYGEDRVANVLTLRTEKSKSAILTAARGLGIDVDTAQYLSSFIQADRGILRTLKQTYYGDEEEGIAPSKQFKKEMDENYPELWKVAQGIEGLINGCGIHAGGVIFVDESFAESTALMRAPDGTIITQFDLHDAEDVSLIKYDILSIEALDKIHNCIDLLCDYGYEEREESLKETYEKIIGIYNLERDDPEMWKLCWEHKVQSLFQMEADSGIRGIALMRPESVDDLAILNSAIRLMATEKGGEMPVNKLARFKAHPSDWDYELKKYGLGKKEKEILEPVIGISYGLCIAQEQFMQLVQLPEIGGFDLTWADKLRKSIAKKNPAEYEQLTDEFFEITKEKGCNTALCNYVWNVLIAMSRGYGFNQSHTLSYSLIGLQELNLVYHYPIIFWNCACLISDSGGNEDSNDREEEDREDNWEEFDDVSMGTFEENNEGQPTDISDNSSKTNNSVKKKTRTVNYGRIL